ncbi:MAG: L-seryl-tRNA(Sec) selenium transferase [Candidatus Dormibacteraeota bacterium]|nr:L-seryl-tRNA(Sec) selenium transferase [Candidatus Dormibacteraeota bacterium]
MPGVGTLLNQAGYRRLQDSYPRELVADAVRARLAVERLGAAGSPEHRLAEVAALLEDWTGPGLGRVINGTGVILHTNLGRAPLGAEVMRSVAEVGAGYLSLEIDLAGGRRGERAPRAAELLRRLTGAEAALVVNNNAAAVLLMLTALAGRREVIVSRGQQVEIGGSFRMPDVMRLSGARMVEVGTTNRTRGADYEAAIGPRTAAVLRVHTSNFQVTGFTESVPLSELGGIARQAGVLLLDDIGSGALEPLPGEPEVRESVRHADVLTFSADKLLGGPQAGIVLGREEAVRRMARHPLARALRADKLTLAALEAALRERLLGRALPVQAMLAARPEDLRRRAAFSVARLRERGVRCDLLPGMSTAGGGSAPGLELPSWLIVLDGPAARLATALRRGTPPIVTRVHEGRCAVDLRTVLPGEEDTLQDAIEAATLAGAGPRRAPSPAVATGNAANAGVTPEKPGTGGKRGVSPAKSRPGGMRGGSPA